MRFANVMIDEAGMKRSGEITAALERYGCWPIPRSESARREAIARTLELNGEQVHGTSAYAAPALRSDPSANAGVFLNLLSIEQIQARATQTARAVFHPWLEEKTINFSDMDALPVEALNAGQVEPEDMAAIATSMVKDDGFMIFVREDQIAAAAADMRISFADAYAAVVVHETGHAVCVSQFGNHREVDPRFIRAITIAAGRAVCFGLLPEAALVSMIPASTSPNLYVSSIELLKPLRDEITSKTPIAEILAQPANTAFKLAHCIRFPDAAEYEVLEEDDTDAEVLDYETAND